MQPGQSNTIWTNTIASSLARETAHDATLTPASRRRRYPLLRPGKDITKTSKSNTMWLCLILWTALSLTPFITVGAFISAPAPLRLPQSHTATFVSNATQPREAPVKDLLIIDRVRPVSVLSTLLRRLDVSTMAANTTRAKLTTLTTSCCHSTRRSRVAAAWATSQYTWKCVRSIASHSAAVSYECQAPRSPCTTGTISSLKQELGCVQIGAPGCFLIGAPGCFLIGAPSCFLIGAPSCFLIGAMSAMIGSWESVSADVFGAVRTDGGALLIGSMFEDVIWCLRRGGMHFVVGLLLLPISALSATLVAVPLQLVVAWKQSLLCLIAGGVSVVVMLANGEAEISASLCRCYHIFLNFGFLLLGAKWFGLQGSISFSH